MKRDLFDEVALMVRPADPDTTGTAWADAWNSGRQAVLSALSLALAAPVPGAAAAEFPDCDNCKGRFDQHLLGRYCFERGSQQYVPTPVPTPDTQP